MKKVKSALTFFLPSRILMRKFPRESSPLFRKLVLEPGVIGAKDITSFTKLFNFNDVWIFHGVAMKQHEKAIVLSGPSGIGKSTLLRKVARMGMAEPMDDGFILVGRAKGCYHVLEGGLYPTYRTITVISKCLRILSRYQSPYLNIDHHHTMAKAIKRGEMLQNLAVWIGSIVTKNRRSERVISSPVRLAKLFLVTHPNDLIPPKRISGETLETADTDDIERIFNNYASCEVFHFYEDGLRSAIHDRILAELRS
jgi:energy-coupling factor transporter ATP-binding protein EcfA2